MTVFCVVEKEHIVKDTWKICGFYGIRSTKERAEELRQEEIEKRQNWNNEIHSRIFAKRPEMLESFKKSQEEKWNIVVEEMEVL